MHYKRRRTWLNTAGCVTLLTAAAIGRVALAADAPTDQAGGETWVDGWFATSDAAKEAQPHWMTPVVTVTPRLEQEYRYDQNWQNRQASVDLTSYGGGKGLELIPTANTELIIGMPAYQTRTTPNGQVGGWADESLLLKYRFASANEEQGNYIVTGFMAVSLPTGSTIFSNRYAIVTPTIAAGKGWGTRAAGFDVQSTLGVGIPTGDKKTLGITTAWNTALQLHLFDKFWPEMEANYTYYTDGPHDGRSQLAVTGGIVLGRFQVTRRVQLVVGGGYQKAVSSFHTFGHAWIMTLRAGF